MKINNQTLHQLWSVEIEMLDAFDTVCKKYGLRYSLAYGTLLGAVRHKGFIPWDDDLDIMMPREDYQRLFEIWSKEVDSEYFLQDYTTDTEDYVNNFAKIRKKHTAFITSEEEKTVRYHTGIFIDIFPGDKYPDGKVQRIVFYVNAALNLLFSRGYTSGTKGLQGLIERALLKLPRRMRVWLRDKTDRRLGKWDEDVSLPYVFPCTIRDCLVLYPNDLFENIIEVDFCGKKYNAVADYDEVLRIAYGDYMRLPPENERTWKHHPVIIDFDHDYNN